MSNFILDCIHGDALTSDVDDYIANWHISNSDDELHNYLGMSKKEYALFVKNENYLNLIIAAHRENKAIEFVVNKEMAIAARSDDHAKSKQLQKWLDNEGLWD